LPNHKNMVVAGAFVNAVVTAAASACYGFVALRLLRRRHAFSTPLFLGTVSVFLLLAALRQVAAGLEHVEWDRTLFLILLVPAGYSIVPLMVVVGRIASERETFARQLLVAFGLAVTIGLVFAYQGGITGPVTSAWGTDWRLNSAIARALLFFIMLLPGLIAGVYLVRVGRRLQSVTGRRSTLLGWSCGVYYVVFTADALGLAGLALVGARLVTAAAAILAYAAYARQPDVEAPGATP